MRSSMWLGVVLVVACKPASPGATEVRDDGCLALPHAPRWGLRASPAGDALYWFEDQVARDYDGDDISHSRLVRYDLATGRTTTVRDWLRWPLHFMRDGSLVALSPGDSRAAVSIRDGHIQTLTPPYFDVFDIEPIDDYRLAIAANADGKSSVYVLDVRRPRPTHLVDATTVYSATPGFVYVMDRDGNGHAVDPVTGKAEPRHLPKDGVPDAYRLYTVENDQVMLRSMREPASSATAAIATKRPWKLVYQGDSVLARAGEGNEYHAMWLVGGEPEVLPRTLGGTSITAIAAAGKQTWILLGHNTGHYEGDLDEVTHESDVCRIDTNAKTLRFATRRLPARYAGVGDAFWAAAGKYPGSRWGIAESRGRPPTLMVFFPEDAARVDAATLRLRARDIHKNVTSLFADPELATEIDYDDGTSVLHRWRRNRLRYRTLTGIGDVRLVDPSDFDLATTGLASKLDDDGTHVTCTGKVTNVRTVTLVDLEVRCIASDRTRVVEIPKLDPQQTFELSQTFDARPADKDNLVVEVFQNNELLVGYDTAEEQRDRSRYDFFVSLRADTQLALRSFDADDELAVVLQVPEKQKLADVDLARVKTAHDRIEAARELLGAGDHELALSVYVGRKYYDWNGTQLVRREP